MNLSAALTNGSVEALVGRIADELIGVSEIGKGSRGIAAGLHIGVVNLPRNPGITEFLENGRDAELPEMIVNLNGNSRRPNYLKLQAKLELARKEDAAIANAALPRLLDLFQTYLRELRPSDLDGSAGLYRLKEELTRRVNVSIAPARINAVLFKEIVVQ